MRQLWPANDPASPDLDDIDLYEAYATPRHKQMVRANMVVSADGAATIEGRVGALTTPSDQRVLLLLRSMSDVLLVGAGTLRAEGYDTLGLSQLHVEWRRKRGLPDHPVLAVVSSRLDFSGSAPALANAPTRPIVITHANASPDRRAALERVADVIVTGVGNDVDLSAALARLADRGLRHVLCEGGPHLLGSVAATGLLRELCLTVAPMATGAGAGRITSGPSGAPSNMRLIHILTGDDALMLRYAMGNEGDDA